MGGSVETAGTGRARAMSVLLVSSKYPPEYSGSGHRAHHTYRRLAERFGVRFEVIASSVATNGNRRYAVDGTPVRLIADKAGWSPAPRGTGAAARLARRLLGKAVSLRDYWAEALPTLAALFREGRRFDLIHVFGNVNVTSAALSYAKMTGKPVIVELVNMVESLDQYEPLAFRVLWGRGFPRNSLIVCISENLRELCRRHGYRDGQIWCRPNPVEEGRFHPERGRKAEYRRKHTRFGDGDTVILHLAKFIPRKMQSFMLEVMPLLPERYKLVLAGPIAETGPLAARDRAYLDGILRGIRERNLGDRVEVRAAFVAEPGELLKAADVFVLPSVQEGLGTPVLEALACGVPVVTNCIPGVFDTWVREGENGFTCPLDPAAWADRIVRAGLFGAPAMDCASAAVLEAASTESIDAEYMRRMLALVSEDAA